MSSKSRERQKLRDQAIGRVKPTPAKQAETYQHQKFDVTQYQDIAHKANTKTPKVDGAFGMVNGIIRDQKRMTRLATQQIAQLHNENKIPLKSTKKETS